MNTISSENSLLLFKNNKNKTNIFIDELTLKEDYLYLFRDIQNILDSNVPLNTFTKLWKDACDDACLRVRQKVRASIRHDYEDAQQDIERVANKFRGNAGEMFAEAFFTMGLGSEYFNGSSYLPVDPQNERFIDATCEMPDGITGCIQIKNYDIKKVDRETFIKSAAEDRLRIRDFNGEIGKYIETPRQFIFSFTDAENLLLNEYKGITVFLGPSWIDSKKIQGDYRSNVKPRSSMFKQIADEIEKFTL